MIIVEKYQLQFYLLLLDDDEVDYSSHVDHAQTDLHLFETCDQQHYQLILIYPGSIIGTTIVVIKILTIVGMQMHHIPHDKRIHVSAAVTGHIQSGSYVGKVYDIIFISD